MGAAGEMQNIDAFAKRAPNVMFCQPSGTRPLKHAW